jgi:ankyrin repeat protein
MDRSCSWQLAELAGKASTFTAQEFRLELSKLLAAGADINTTEHLESSGKPPLRLCCECSDVSVSSGIAFRSLLEAGAEVNQVAAFDGRTALHTAAVAGKFSEVEALLEYGADPSLKTTRVTGADQTVVTTAAALAKQKGHTKVVTLLDHNRFMETGMRVIVHDYGEGNKYFLRRVAPCSQPHTLQYR